MNGRVKALSSPRAKSRSKKPRLGTAAGGDIGSSPVKGPPSTMVRMRCSDTGPSLAQR